MEILPWMVLGAALTRGWPASALRELLAKLEATDFTYGKERRLWTACQTENAEAVRKQLAEMGVKVGDGEKCLEAVVAAVRLDGDRRRRREFADRLAIAARLDPVAFEKMMAVEVAKRQPT